MINLIAAVGQQGEIGLKGTIPWFSDETLDNRVLATAISDLGWFARQTEGGVLVVGGRTYDEMLTMGFKPGTRDIHRWEGGHPVLALLSELKQKYPGRDIWICGGCYTYATFMPHVERFYISKIPWSGPADKFMPPLLPNWGYIGGTRYVQD